MQWSKLKWFSWQAPASNKGGSLKNAKKLQKGDRENFGLYRGDLRGFSCLAGQGGVGTIFGGVCTASACHGSWLNYPI